MSTKPSEIRLVCENRKARFEYDLDEFYEAGMVLLGSEVKSLRAGNAHLNEAWVGLQGDQVVLFKAHIAPYPQATHVNHEPDRPRPLLLHAPEAARLRSRVRERGLTVIPVKMYFQGRWAKVTIALGKGRKLHDKREAIREREDKREAARAMRR